MQAINNLDRQPPRNYAVRDEEMKIKQETPQLSRDRGDSSNFMRKQSFEPRQEFMEQDSPEEVSDEVDFIMHSNLMWVYEYVARNDGKIVWFVCKTLIDRDQIKILCTDCSKTEYIRASLSDTTNEYFVDPK